MFNKFFRNACRLGHKVGKNYRVIQASDVNKVHTH